jgi:hypothetical protein
MKKYVLARTNPVYGTNPVNPVRTYFCGLGSGNLPAYGDGLNRAFPFDSIEAAQMARALCADLTTCTVHAVKAAGGRTMNRSTSSRGSVATQS